MDKLLSQTLDINLGGLVCSTVCCLLYAIHCINIAFLLLYQYYYKNHQATVYSPEFQTQLKALSAKGFMVVSLFSNDMEAEWIWHIVF